MMNNTQSLKFGNSTSKKDLSSTYKFDFRNSSLYHCKSRSFKPPVTAGGTSELVFGDQNVPLRGTCYRNSSFAGTWFNDSLRQPLFPEESKVFTIDHEKTVQNSDALMMTRSSLNRIAEDRPLHKIVK